MTCTAHCCAIDSQFDRRVAQRDLENYRRNGPSATTRQLLSATRQAGIVGASVCDIGGGIGAIAHELLATGAAQATVVDASAAYLAAARDEAERRQWSERLKVLNGDFTSLAHDIEWVRFAMAMENAIRALRHRAFRVYIFPNAHIDKAIRRTGFTPRFQQRGVWWVVALYERSNVAQ